jgi:hypothetical protein
LYTKTQKGSESPLVLPVFWDPKMIIDDKEVTSVTAYKAGYDDFLNGLHRDSATIYGSLIGHYDAGYATGRMKVQADNRRTAAQHRLHETL